MLPAACERSQDSSPSTGPLEARGRPYRELNALAEAVAEARTILPRVPADARPLSLASSGAETAAEPRLVLQGEASLLRPSAFPELPQRLVVEVFLDEREPPGGYLRVTDAQGTSHWPILDAVVRGRRESSFAYSLRVADPAARLRYLVLLGVPFRSGGRDYRSLEGYLVLPGAGGELSSEGPLYPIDFGYRHAEPPLPTRAAEALAERVQTLRAALAQWEALALRVAELRSAAQRLQEAQVPSEQAEQRRQDLQRFTAQSQAADVERSRAAAGLRAVLLAAYRERVAASEAWLAFVESNAYRWRTPAERRTAYLPLQTLRAAYPALERSYGAVQGDADPDLRAAREAMEQALLREQAQAPGAG